MGDSNKLKSLRVLVVEDSPDDADLLLRSLRKGGYEVEYVRVFNESDLRSELQNRTWDIVITDFTMPQFDAFSAIKVVRGSGLDLPIIVVSGTVGDDVAVEAMKSGAHDYLLKTNFTRLVPAVEREIREAENRRRWRESEDQLRQAQKMEAIGRLAGGIAHDFNNILGVHLMLCDALMERFPEADPTYRDVEEIRKASERAAALTRQLLAFSRKQLMELRVLNLNDVLGGTQQMLQRLIGANIDLIFKADPGLGLVKADVVQVEQIVMNLAVNAKDAMEHGGRLTISTTNAVIGPGELMSLRAVPAGEYVSVTVSDTGSGMAESTKARIFEPFFTTKEQGKGTGLGLATVYGIVKQSNGFIFVNSELGKGTTFRIFFPRIHPDDQPRPRVKTQVLPKRDSGQTVLVLEDQAMFREVMSSLLKEQGFKVICPANTTEAAQVIENHQGPIDILLTDVVMPGASGPELAKKFLKKRAQARVIFMSGYTDEALEKFDFQDADISFLQKPFSMAEFLEKASGSKVD